MENIQRLYLGNGGHPPTIMGKVRYVMDGQTAGFRGLRAKPQRGTTGAFAPELQAAHMHETTEQNTGNGSLLLRSFVLALGVGTLLLVGLSIAS